MILLANKLVIWGAAFITTELIILGIQQLIQLNSFKVRGQHLPLREKNQDLAKMNEKLTEENAFLKEW